MNSALKNNNFDLLRLIFASMVVFFHIGLLSESPQLAWMHQYISSTFAVQAFFVVSGFLVTMSYENTHDWRRYASKRLRRIVPAYVVVVIGAALLLALVSKYPADQYFIDPGFWKYLGFNLTLSNFNAPTLPGVFEEFSEPAVNGSLWTIKIEVAFYCFVPLMAWLIRRFGYQPILIVLFLASVGWKAGFTWLAEHHDNALYAKLAKQLPGQISFFMGGAWAYYRTRNGGGLHWLHAVAAVIIYCLVSGYLYIFLAPIAVTIFVYWAAISAPKLSEIGKHGDFSYGIYLYHFPIVQCAKWAGFFDSNPYPTTLFIVLITAILAVVSWKLVEQPFLKR